MKPKILGLHHDHIDGSSAAGDILQELYKLSGKDFPFTSFDDVLKYFRNESIDIVERFNTVTGVLQTEETLELMAYTYGKKRASEGYRYIEGKFAPQYHLNEGLTIR